MPALYLASLQDFVGSHPSQLLGDLTSGLAREGFDTTRQTTFSWEQQLSDLQGSCRRLMEVRAEAATWPVLLEYVLPVLGLRVDCVLIAGGLIFVIEYKAGYSASARSALTQAQDYAASLADFHEASRGRVTVPVAVGVFRSLIPFDVVKPHRGGAIQASELARLIEDTFAMWGGAQAEIDRDEWNQSRYFPVPTIIEAASAIYRNHDVKAIAHSRAGQENLERTLEAVTEHVRDARERSVRKLIVLTGVPGAGKTLAGLNAVQAATGTLNLEHEQAAFLSGNGPLVAVIQDALKRDSKGAGRGSANSIKSRVREIHRFVRDSYAGTSPPSDRLIVFDEAQRAWTAAKNLKKFGRNVSEPEMVLEIMARHPGWTVVVALVGGGQEIHGGEAGLAAWGDALIRHPEWEVVTSPEAIRGGASVAGSRLFRDSIPRSLLLLEEPALHLNVSRRSFTSETSAAWVNAVLDGDVQGAARLAEGNPQAYLTRSLPAARAWLRDRTSGTRRCGFVASSGAARLRAEGVETPSFDFMRGVDFVRWFLEPDGDHRSSNQLEVAMSEFEMQGLELDVVGLLWGGDLIFPNGRPIARRLSGTSWRVVGGTGDPQAAADDPRTRILNKYRVLLTRFRKAMVIFVPTGSASDSTRSPEEFDAVYQYLLRCGARPLAENGSLRAAAQLAQ